MVTFIDGSSMRVSDILRKKGTSVHTISQEATVGEALAELNNAGIGALVVSNDGATIAGILSERDIVRALHSVGHTVVDRPVASIMTSDVVSCDPADQIDWMMSTMTSNRFRHMPVLENSELAGLVSIGDVVAARVSELENTAAVLEEYIYSGR